MKRKRHNPEQVVTKPRRTIPLRSRQSPSPILARPYTPPDSGVALGERVDCLTCEARDQLTAPDSTCTLHVSPTKIGVPFPEVPTS